MTCRMTDAVVAVTLKNIKEHVKLAKKYRHDPWWCVVAQALRKIRGVIDAKVYKSYTVVWFSNGKAVRYRTPFALAEALTYWDRMGEWKLKPGAYCLEVPLPSQTIKAQKRYAKRAKLRVVAGSYHYVYGPRGAKESHHVSARHFFGCLGKKAA